VKIVKGISTKSIVDAIAGTANTTPTIFNIACASNAVEYSQVLPANTKKFVLKARNSSSVKIAYTVGDTSILYFTLNSGFAFTDDNSYSGVTIYFTCSKNNEIIEIIAYQ